MQSYLKQTLSWWTNTFIFKTNTVIFRVIRSFILCLIIVSALFLDYFFDIGVSPIALHYFVLSYFCLNGFIKEECYPF